MSGKTSQRKGAAGERELVNVLNNLGFDVKRGGSQTYGEVPDITGLTGVHIEVKRVEKLNIDTAMQQAVRDAERFEDGAPTVFHRRNRRPWLVTMRLEDWIKLYKRDNPLKG
jgi:Holliday junction resolvase